MNTEGTKIFRAPAAGYFRVGSITPPKRSRKKPTVVERKKNYKMGIDARVNRKLRSRLSHDMGKDKKKIHLRNLRSSATKKSTTDSKLGGGEESGAEKKLVSLYVDQNLGDSGRTMRLVGNKSANSAVFGVSAGFATPSNAVFERKLVDGSEKKYTGSTKEKLAAFYADRNPSKIGDVGKTMAKYAGNEGQLFLNLAKRYNVDPAVFGVDALFGSSMTPCDKNTTGAFETYASGNNTFGFLSTPKVQPSGFGSFNQASSASHTSKGRRTINSLNTYNDGLRLSSDSEGDMEC